MEKVLISRKTLAERWDYDSTRAIIDMEQEGIITRIPEVSSPRYSMEEILRIENLGKKVNPAEVRCRELELLIKEKDKRIAMLEAKLNKVQMALI